MPQAGQLLAILRIPYRAKWLPEKRTVTNFLFAD